MVEKRRKITNSSTIVAMAAAASLPTPSTTPTTTTTSPNLRGRRTRNCEQIKKINVKTKNGKFLTIFLFLNIKKQNRIMVAKISKKPCFCCLSFLRETVFWLSKLSREVTFYLLCYYFLESWTFFTKIKLFRNNK